MKKRKTNEHLRQIIAFVGALFGCLCLLGGCANRTKTHSKKPGAKIQKVTLTTHLVLGNIGYNTKTGIINMPERIIAVAFSPDSQYVACVSPVKVMKEEVGTQPGIVAEGHSYNEILPNTLAGSYIIVFNMATGVAKLQSLTESVVKSLAFSADSQMLFIGCEAHSVDELHEDRAGCLQVWDVGQGKMLRNIEIGAYHMAVAPTGHMLALAKEESLDNPSTITIFDTRNWHILHTFKSMWNVSDLDDITFSSDGGWFGVAFSAMEDWAGEVWIWDTRSGKRILRINDDLSPEPLRGVEGPLAITVPADKQSNGTIYCGDTQFKVKYVGELLKVLEKSLTLTKPSENVRSIERFNPQRVVSSSDEADDVLSVWDLNSQKVIASLKADGYSRLEYSSDGKYLAEISEEKTCQIVKLPS